MNSLQFTSTNALNSKFIWQTMHTGVLIDAHILIDVNILVDVQKNGMLVYCVL